MIALIRPMVPAILITALATGCGAATGTHPVQDSPRPGSPGPGSPAPSSTDPPTVAALLRIAQVFNNDYDNGNFGAVYDRWDASSQALISRAEYIRRHTLCAPATHAVARVEGALPGQGGAWHVSYRIDNSPLADTWFYVKHRWVFDIALSNPGAARNYRLPFARYAAAVGCNAH